MDLLGSFFSHVETLGMLSAGPQARPKHTYSGCVLLGVSVDVWTNSPTGGAKTRFVQLQEPSSAGVDNQQETGMVM